MAGGWGGGWNRAGCVNRSVKTHLHIPIYTADINTSRPYVIVAHIYISGYAAETNAQYISQQAQDICNTALPSAGQWCNDLQGFWTQEIQVYCSAPFMYRSPNNLYSSSDVFYYVTSRNNPI